MGQYSRRTGVFLLGLIALLTASRSAEALPAGWILQKDTVRCTLATDPASDGPQVWIRREGELAFSALIPVIARRNLQNFPGAEHDGVASGLMNPVYWVVSTTENGPPISSLRAKRIDGASTIVHAEIFGSLDAPLIRHLSAEADPQIFVRGNVLSARLRLPPGLDQALAALDACTPTLLEPNLPLRPIGNSANWINGEDILSALSGVAAKNWRASRFALMVGVDGRVTDCRNRLSTGHSGMDTAICRRLIARGKFQPATDANGRVVAARYDYALPAGKIAQ
ncbi:hypothetical protein [Sphingosinicella microcystinivorans]|uniref:TonB family protein n=1 Tax=Sphingosinicella microcystinivorans TaxID=335406 RepID=A0AAD1D4Q7_SPHMI|nr:hypothetical protein [Sphingosinicella microcystinivorans]RKS85009.1 hypothetical protein DFR51_3609 [Sphingosinicella microcystinivorans]BBE33333.1 hypothetical protein SmB9_09910 [Sphingosinicella microcystinivorans]